MWFTKNKVNKAGKKNNSINMEVELKTQPRSFSTVTNSNVSRSGSMIRIYAPSGNALVSFIETRTDRGYGYTLDSIRSYDSMANFARIVAEDVLVPLIGAAGIDYYHALVFMSSNDQFHLKIADAVMSEEWLFTVNGIRTPWTGGRYPITGINIDDHDAWSTID
jgi:hypothetical protein